MPHPVRFDIQAGQQNVEWSGYLSLAQSAEAWGYDTFWAFDHLYPIFSDPGGPCYEGWTTLAAIAQATESIRIGHLVNGNTYRHPSLVAKMATTVDHISGGRLNLGLGAGWFELEHSSLGFDFLTTRGRLDALDEAARIIRGMLAGEAVTLDGKHYQVAEARCVPSPVQDSIPVMIGGAGRRILLRIVAEHANIWNFNGSPEELRDLVGVLHGHTDAIGRDGDEIEKSVMLAMVYTDDEDRQEMMASLLGAAFQQDAATARGRMMIGNKDACLEKIAAYREAGITRFIFMSMAPYNLDEMQAFAEDVAPLVR